MPGSELSTPVIVRPLPIWATPKRLGEFWASFGPVFVLLHWEKPTKERTMPEPLSWILLGSCAS